MLLCHFLKFITFIAYISCLLVLLVQASLAVRNSVLGIYDANTSRYQLSAPQVCCLT